MMAELVPNGNNNLFHLLNTELRHVEASKLNKLSAILDSSKDWAVLLDELTNPKSQPISISEPLNLSLDSINIIERQVCCGKSPTLALLNYWSITGRRRPTLRVLLSYLHVCKLKRAEDFVCQSILGMKIPDKSPPASKVLSSELDIEDQYKFGNLGEIIDKLGPECPRYSFKSVYKSTNAFCHKPFNWKTNTGSKIGEGRFSCVFRAKVNLENEDPSSQQMVAAKLLKSECNMKYLSNEIELTLKVRHENIIELLGVAIGRNAKLEPTYLCLIYKYMENGSLLSCLSLGLPTRDMDNLEWRERIDIAKKVARGISHLHNLAEGSIIHRDIKTANIFIDSQMEPKIGDFTLVRQLISSETQFSQNIIGTSVYMPIEAFRGDISTKFDTFSFGIVLLELLTGMRPFQEDTNEDLFTYVSGRLADIEDEQEAGDENSLAEAKCRFLAEILDKRAGDWDERSSQSLFRLALKATESRKKDRPELSSLLPELEAISTFG